MGKDGDYGNILQGKKAFITGAGRGIGRAVALGLAQAGAAVTVTDIQEDDARAVAGEIAGAEGESLALRTDVTEPESISESLKAHMEHFGGLDILVPNAGVHYVDPLLQSKPEVWDHTFAVNVRGVALTCQEAAPYLARASAYDYQTLEGEKSKIVITASIGAFRAAPEFAAYLASKSAVINLTWTLATALAPMGVCVNAVCPGMIHTEMWEGIARQIGRLRGVPPEQIKAERIAGIPFKKYGEPEDLVGTYVFLASRHSDYVTGQNLAVGGGDVMR